MTGRSAQLAVALALLAAAGTALLVQWLPPRDGGGARAESGKAPLAVRRTEPPRTLPNLQFVDAENRPRSLAEFRGRAVLLNVWATWCAPCRAEMPALDRLQAALGGPAFEVVALSIDRGGLAAVKPFFDELDLRALRIYVDASAEALGRLDSIGIPLTLFVDEQGRERWRVLGPAPWDRADVIDYIRRDLAAR